MALVGREGLGLLLMGRRAAAAVLAGDGEEDLPWSIDCYGGARWGGLRSPEVSERLGAP